MHTLLIDNYDSFTYNLSDCMKQLGLTVQVIRNDDCNVQDLKHKKFDNIVLSPGPETPARAGITMEVIDAFHGHLPMLGICLGHQAIGTFFGAELVKAAIPMHGKPVVVHHYGHPLFKGLDETFEVMCYHSLVLSGMESTNLKVLAADSSGDPMAIFHEKYLCFGVQYHPESILTPSGMKLLENWFRLIRKS